MNKYKLYSTGCPSCTVLKTKLEKAEIDFVVVNDTAWLMNQGIMTVPVLVTPDGEVLLFAEAVAHVNKVGGLI